MAVDPEVVAKALDQVREEAPGELQPTLLEIEEFWDRKLWHQLTELLSKFFESPDSQSLRLPLFKNFILTFSEKINQLRLVSLGLAAATQCSDDRERLEFLQGVTSKVEKPSSQDAFVYASVACADVKLRLGELDSARKDLDHAESILDTFDSVETEVHAAFYRTNAAQFQARQDFAAYYKNALLYLACVELSSLAPAECRARAYDLSVAALVSDTIYNFGELLLHPILDFLLKTDDEWLRELLFAFNRGDLAAFSSLEGKLAAAPLLLEHKQFLWQKISLAALTEAVFRRPPHDRAMTFDTIADETRVQLAEIELLVMKALSLGLLRGSIDQVDQVARITWVQPKVLDMAQIDNMRLRLKDWDSNVNQLGHWIEGVGKDVWAA